MFAKSEIKVTVVMDCKLLSFLGRKIQIVVENANEFTILSKKK